MEPETLLFGFIAQEMASRLLFAAGGVVAGTVLGTLMFGRGYKRRIAALEAQAQQPAINQTFNFIAGTAPDDLAHKLRDAMDRETVRGLQETIRRLPQEPLGDGHTYAKLPDGTNILILADGTIRLALPVRLSFEAEAGSPEASFAPASVRSEGSRQVPDDGKEAPA